jgi:hypothetical protein
MKRSLKCFLSVIFVAAGGLAVGCQSPTQGIVAVYTDMPCEPVDAESQRDALTDFRIFAAPTREALAIKLDADQFDAEAACLPAADGRQRGRQLGTLVLAPGAAEAHIAVRAGVWALGQPRVSAAACAKPGTSPCIVARRLLRYASNQSLDVPIALDAACARIQCPTEQTCEKGACKGIPQVSKDPPLPPPVDAATPTVDAGLDAGGDSAPMRTLPFTCSKEGVVAWTTPRVCTGGSPSCIERSTGAVGCMDVKNGECVQPCCSNRAPVSNPKDPVLQFQCCLESVGGQLLPLEGRYAGPMGTCADRGKAADVCFDADTCEKCGATDFVAPPGRGWGTCVTPLL